MKIIRGGSGLGDSLYLRPLVDYFVKAGEDVVVKSDYADIFIDSGARVDPFTRVGCNVIAHYVRGKTNAATNQWDDVRGAAGVREHLPFSFKWTVRNRALNVRVRAQAAGKPVVLVHGGRVPMARRDGFAAELLPRQEAFEAALVGLGDVFKVAIGRDGIEYPLAVDLDLTGQTTVADMIDLARECDAVIAQCSFAIPLAEAFDKPLLCVWSARGLVSRTEYIRLITPLKVFCKATSRFVMDDRLPEEIVAVADAFAGVSFATTPA